MTAPTHHHAPGVDRGARLRSRRLPRAGVHRTPTSRTTRSPTTSARASWSYSAGAMAQADRRELQTELIRALADGPGVVVFEGAFEHDVVDRASDGLHRAHRGPARRGRRQPATTSARPAPTTASGTPRRSWHCTAPEVFAEYYANDALAWSAKPGWARATRSPHRSTSSIPVAPRRFRTATTTSASSTRISWRPIPRTCTACRRP